MTGEMIQGTGITNINAFILGFDCKAFSSRIMICSGKEMGDGSIFFSSWLKGAMHFEAAFYNSKRQQLYDEKRISQGASV